MPHRDGHCHAQNRAQGRRPVRPGARARCLRRRLHRQPARTSRSQKIIQNGLPILENLEHRGAVGADPLMGDGAGILVQIPHRSSSRRAAQLGFAPARARQVRRRLHLHAAGRRRCAGRWSASSRRSSRTKARPSSAGATCRPTTPRCRKAPEIVATEPCHRQVIIGRGDDVADEEAFERKLYIIRKVISAQDLLGLSRASRPTSTSCR